jgi:hypothetical protein
VLVLSSTSLALCCRAIVFRFVDVFSCIRFNDFCSMHGLQFYDFVLHSEIFLLFAFFVIMDNQDYLCCFSLQILYLQIFSLFCVYKCIMHGRIFQHLFILLHSVSKISLNIVLMVSKGLVNFVITNFVLSTR